MGLRQGVIELLHALAGRVGKGEKLLCDGIAEDLELEKYTVEQCYDGAKAYDLLLNEAFDLLILDLNLPGMDGLELLRHIRTEQPELRVLILSARSQLSDKVAGLDLGADDYLTKPFEIIELLARVESVLRRYHKTEQVLTEGDLVVDTASRTVTKKGETISLTKKEFDLLLLFVRNKNIALYRETIYERIWGGEYMGDSRTVDLHVQRMRKKAGLEEQIQTVYRVGYRYCP